MNNTRERSAPAWLEIVLCGPDGRVRQDTSSVVAVPGIAATSIVEVADLSAVLEPDRLHLLILRLVDRRGGELAQNSDWFHGTQRPQPDNAYAPLRRLDAAELQARSRGQRRGGEWHVDLTLRNPGSVCAFQVRLQLLDRGGARLTPFYAADNYLTVLPGQSRVIGLSTRATDRRPRLVLSGWNVAATEVPVRWQ